MTGQAKLLKQFRRCHPKICMPMVVESKSDMSSRATKKIAIVTATAKQNKIDLASFADGTVKK
jgi:hypothetical protein